jgi:hypothetical protein
MSDLANTYIGVYEDTANGPTYYGESYAVEEIGVVPNVGDILVDAGISAGADKSAASSYTVKEVVRRYFIPRSSDRVGARIALIVQSRPARSDELDFVAHR